MTASRTCGIGLLICMGVGQASVAAEPAAKPIRYTGKMEIVVHRGANHLAPENTMASARKAVELGCQYVEVDVRTSADGVMYIMHDPNVARTTDGEGFLRKMTSDQIDKLDAGSWFRPEFKGERVPRLRTLLEWIRGKAKVYFDVKDADLQKLLAMVRELKMQDDVFFWFGNRIEAVKFRRIDKDMPLKINVKDLKELRLAKTYWHAQIVETSIDVATPEFVKAANDLGIKVMILYTGSDRDVFRRIVRSGAQMVNLDRPMIFIEVWRQEQQRPGGKKPSE
ncbi:MAG: glycerophosphodiester phosphodiesterase family protein [Phycisphaerae bacterium]|nr:glycerophosphodiester phosphodiesterase family protein [Phycisphaerae bacterium]